MGVRQIYGDISGHWAGGKITKLKSDLKREGGTPRRVVDHCAGLHRRVVLCARAPSTDLTQEGCLLCTDPSTAAQAFSLVAMISLMVPSKSCAPPLCASL